MLHEQNVQIYFIKITLKLSYISKTTMHNQRKEHQIPHVDPVKFVQKGNGVIKGYAVNTFHGMVKSFNQDRVSIIMNITKPNYKGRWPKCSYFGVFDGHGGDVCSNFLKDNLHRFITQNTYFPGQPIQALKIGFKKAQTEFMKFAESCVPIERSGSCAVVILIIDSYCYIANVGDSRAVLSCNRGTKVYSLSHDHKPDSPVQRQRIEKANGKIYQSFGKSKTGALIPGPFRISPGKLSVSRSFGDIQAKIQKYGGNPKVLIAKPQITYFEINHEQHDFIVVGSDGIYDKLTNGQIIDCFWSKKDISIKNSNNYIGQACSQILNTAMNHYSMDNITSLLIVFEDNGRFDLPHKRDVIQNITNNSKISKKSHLEDQQKQKQNNSKMIINGLKSDRNNSSSNLLQKMSMKRKQSAHLIEGSNRIENSMKNMSKNHLKKQCLNKNVSHSVRGQKKQAYMDRQKLMEKILKNRNLQKIR